MIETMGMPTLWPRDQSKARAAAAVLAALLGHGALVGLALQQEPALLPVERVTEVELLRPHDAERRPEPPAELKPELPQPAAAARAERHLAARRVRPSSAPEPAAAAPVRTVADHVKTLEEPVRFVTDPNGSAFGYGVVARGGTASEGAQTAARTLAPGAPAAEVATAPRLSRPPRLSESEPCRGFFPVRAQVDRGEAALQVRVEADGRVRSVSVSRETPLGQGFGAAARECLLSKRFSPALDLAGEPVSVVSPVTVRFSR